MRELLRNAVDEILKPMTAPKSPISPIGTNTGNTVSYLQNVVHLCQMLPKHTLNEILLDILREIGEKAELKKLVFK